MITLYTIHSVLALRLHCLYDNRRLDCFLVVLLISAVAAEVYTLVTFAPGSGSVNVGLNIGRICDTYEISEVSLVW